MVPPEYFRTRLRSASGPTVWPDRFVIVSGWAPTGDTWSAEENLAADDRLCQELRHRGLVHHRVTGYDGEGDHEEPSWAVDCSLEEGVALGLLFHQLAIFEVFDGELWVHMCASGERAFVDLFLHRLDDPFSAPFSVPLGPSRRS